MRKFTLLLAALAVTVGAASAMACDHDKASSASASKSSSGSCCSSSSNASTQLTSSGGGECSGMKSASAGSCAAHKNASAMAGTCKDGDVADAVFQVASIHGDCCVDGVASALSTVKGVQYVNVDVKTKKAYVCTRGAKIDQKAALKSLKAAGFANAVYLGADKKYSMKEGVKASKTSAASKV
ncbi:MAG TPA: heavy metal-associated domain-containing protein [Candidatus Eisenbacteria bacterium]|nr:heavy metal-associated domain-containing protein [Candidatus Eisenbacteria bacterium]